MQSARKHAAGAKHDKMSAIEVRISFDFSFDWLKKQHLRCYCSTYIIFHPNVELGESQTFPSNLDCTRLPAIAYFNALRFIFQLHVLLFKCRRKIIKRTQKSLTPWSVMHAILYYTILYYTILYYTILYYTILYYTILKK